MICKVLRVCAVFTLLLGTECVESLEMEDNRESAILIKANTADVSIKGEVKDIISVEFDGEKRELSLFEDNGEETADSSRTFGFNIKTMNSTGAKLKLEGKDGLSFDESIRCWTLSGTDDRNSKVLIWFRLMGRSKGAGDEEGALEQRGWDEDGCCYTFKQHDGVGEWKIIAHSIKKITDEKRDIYKGSLKVSIVAA